MFIERKIVYNIILFIFIPGMVLSRMNAITGPQKATFPSTMFRTMSKVSLPRMNEI